MDGEIVMVNDLLMDRNMFIANDKWGEKERNINYM